MNRFWEPVSPNKLNRTAHPSLLSQSCVAGLNERTRILDGKHLKQASEELSVTMDKGKQAMENMKNIKMPQGAGRPALALAQFAAFVGAATYGAYHSIYNVPAGHRAVVYSRIDGVGQTVMEQGTHFVLPWLQRPIIFDVRTRPRTYASLTGTKDLQMINISIRVLSKPDRGRLQWIYTHLGLGTFTM